jgi:hypothetical protein
MPHLKPITTVAAIMGEDHSLSYVTGGNDKRLVRESWRRHFVQLVKS